jgi:hypothetical protein
MIAAPGDNRRWWWSLHDDDDHSVIEDDTDDDDNVSDDDDNDNDDDRDLHYHSTTTIIIIIIIYITNRDLLRDHLASFGIETRNYFFPNHLQPCFTHHFQSHCGLKNAETLSSLGLYLPSYYYLEEKDVIFISSHVVGFFDAWWKDW